MALPTLDLQALAHAGARLELQRILSLFPDLRAEVATFGTRTPRAPRAATLGTAAPAPSGTHTHTCESCGAGFTPDARQATRARVCRRTACKRWLHTRAGEAARPNGGAQ